MHSEIDYVTGECNVKHFLNWNFSEEETKQTGNHFDEIIIVFVNIQKSNLRKFYHLIARNIKLK